MELLISIIIAITPCIILGKYIYNKSNEKVPKKTILKLLFLGILAFIISGELNVFSEKIFKLSESKNQLFIIHLIKYIFSIALNEELLKFIASYFIEIKNKYKTNTYNIILSTTFISLGFTAIENIDYTLNYGYSTGLLRAIFPIHISLGILMGYFIYLAYYEKKNNNNIKYYKNMLLSIIIPVLYHALFNTTLTHTSNIKFLILPFIIVITIYTIKKAKEISFQQNPNENQHTGFKLIALFSILTLIFSIPI